MIFETRAFVVADVTKEYASKKDGAKKKWREITIVGKNDTVPIPVNVAEDPREFEIETRREYDFKFELGFAWGKINLKVLEKKLVELEK